MPSSTSLTNSSLVFGNAALDVVRLGGILFGRTEVKKSTSLLFRSIVLATWIASTTPQSNLVKYRDPPTCQRYRKKSASDVCFHMSILRQFGGRAGAELDSGAPVVASGPGLAKDELSLMALGWTW